MSQTTSLFIGIWPHILAPVVFLVLFTTPPSPLRRIVYFSVFLTFAYLCFSKLPIPPGWARLQLAVSLVWMYYLDWLAKMLLRRPEHDFWRVGRPAHEAEKLPLGWEKLSWAFSLLSTPRGVGWNFQIPNLRPRTKLLGRWWFVAGQVGRVIILTAFSGWLGREMVNWNSSSEGFWRALLVPLVGMKCWSDAESQYALFDAVLVLVGVAEEKDCIPLFGNNLTQLDSLREFWGQLWHQNFRMLFQDCGRAVCRLVGIRGHTQLYWAVQVWSGFLISGAVHALAISSISTDEVTIDKAAQFRALFIFFVLQAVGVTLEGLFLDTPVRDLTLYEVGLEDEMLIGRIWTFGWLLFSGYWALESRLRANWSPLAMIVLLTPTLKRDWTQSRA